MWNEENLENNVRMKEEEGYATMKIDEVSLFTFPSKVASLMRGLVVG